MRDRCISQKEAQRACGPKNAKQLAKRLDDLKAAANLFVMYRLPGKCHSLSKDRAGQDAVHLDGGYRLIFEPANDPLPRNADGAVDPSQVTAIRIVSIEDYHG